MTDTIHLGLPLIEASQAQKHVTHNEALARLDALVQLSVQSRALSAPPSSPADGDRYIVKATGTGAFAGKDNQIAQFSGSGWEFFAPQVGWLAYVAAESVLVAWDGSAWSSAASSAGDITTLQNLALLGVGTTADSTNPFSAKLNNALWVAKTTGEGGDGNLRYKMSKESATKTLSVLFQDNFSGRAEIGLTGDDDFHFKVSPDGSTWIDALTVDKSTGSTKLAAGFFLTGDISPAQITADQNDYNPTGLSTTSVLRLSTDASRNVTGLAGGSDGRIVAMVNVGTNNLVLKDASAASSAANRFAFGADLTLAAKQSVIVWYDATDQRWKLLAAPGSGGGTIDFSSISGTAAIAQGGTGATTASGARSNLGLGSAATLDVGTTANKILQLDGSARLPAVDGSQLTNLPGGGGGGSVPADLDLLLAELALGLADANNVAQFLGSAGNRFADSFDTLAYVDVAGSTNLESGSAGLLKPTQSGFSRITGATPSTPYGGTAANINDNNTGTTASGISPGNQSGQSVASRIVAKLDFGASKTVTKIEARQYSCSAASSGTNLMGLYYSTDNTTWTQLGAGFTLTTTPTDFTATGNVSARYVAVVTSPENWSTLTQTLGDLNAYEPATTDNMTAKSAALTAAAAPGTAKLVARTKHIDSITLGTDLLFSVSRDGGTTWTTASMTDRFTANSIHVLESASIDISAQPSGTAMKWKAVTANNKVVELHDVYLYWS